MGRGCLLFIVDTSVEYIFSLLVAVVHLGFSVHSSWKSMRDIKHLVIPEAACVWKQGGGGWGGFMKWLSRKGVACPLALMFFKLGETHSHAFLPKPVG